MMAQRAQEIMASLGVIEVHYQGSKVWLEEVQGDDAMVTMIENPEHKMRVKIGDLVEQ